MIFVAGVFGGGLGVAHVLVRARMYAPTAYVHTRIRAHALLMITLLYYTLLCGIFAYINSCELGFLLQ